MNANQIQKLFRNLESQIKAREAEADELEAKAAAIREEVPGLREAVDLVRRMFGQEPEAAPKRFFRKNQPAVAQDPPLRTKRTATSKGHISVPRKGRNTTFRHCPICDETVGAAHLQKHAVEMIKAGDKSQREIAQALGVSECTVSAWKKQAGLEMRDNGRGQKGNGIVPGSTPKPLPTPGVTTAPKNRLLCEYGCRETVEGGRRFVATQPSCPIHGVQSPDWDRKSEAAV